MKAELVIYAVDYHAIQPHADEGDYSFYELDNEEIANLSDEEFIQIAEDNGQAHSLDGFLREVEAHNFGARSDVVRENMQFRAYLIDTENPETTPIRVDISEIKMRVEDVGYNL